MTGPSMRSVSSPLNKPSNNLSPLRIETSEKISVPGALRTQAYTSTSSTTPSTDGHRNNSPKADFKNDLGLLLRGMDLEGQRQRDMEDSLEAALDECKEKVQAEHAAVLNNLEIDLKRLQQEKHEEVKRAETELQQIKCSNAKDLEILKMKTHKDFEERELQMQNEMDSKYQALQSEREQKWELELQKEKEKYEAKALEQKKEYEKRAETEMKTFEERIATMTKQRQEELSREAEMVAKKQKNAVLEALNSHGGEEMVLMAQDLKQNLENIKKTLMQSAQEASQENEKIMEQMSEFEAKRATVRENIAKEQIAQLKTFADKISKQHEHQLMNLLEELDGRASKDMEEAGEHLIQKLENHKAAFMMRLEAQSVERLSTLQEDIVNHMQKVAQVAVETDNRETIATQTDPLPVELFAGNYLEQCDAALRFQNASRQEHEKTRESGLETLDIKTLVSHKIMIEEQMLTEFEKVKSSLQEELAQEKANLEVNLMQSVAQVQAELKVKQLAELNRMKEHHTMNFVKAEDYLEAVNKSKSSDPFQQAGESASPRAKNMSSATKNELGWAGSPGDEAHKRSLRSSLQSTPQQAEPTSNDNEREHCPDDTTLQNHLCRLKEDIVQELGHIIKAAVCSPSTVKAQFPFGKDNCEDPRMSISKKSIEATRNILRSILHEVLVELRKEANLPANLETPCSATNDNMAGEVSKERNESFCPPAASDGHKYISKLNHQVPSNIHKPCGELRKTHRRMKSRANHIDKATLLQAPTDFIRLQDRLHQERRHQIEKSRENWMFQWREMYREASVDVLHAKQSVLLDMWATLEMQAQQLNSDIHNVNQLRAKLKQS